jgi:hypothetical protein
MAKRKANKKKEVTTLINFILDKSGSMGAIQDTVISGFNEYINGLKNQKGKFKFSLTLFDTMSIEKPYVAVDLELVKPLSRDTYRPNAGTPLYDAVVDTIEAVYEEVQNKKDYAVVTVIMTDGEENSSQKHDEKCLRELVKKLEGKGNWTFTFMGANIDAYGAAMNLGISAGNTMAWNSDIQGTRDAFRGLAAASANYAVYAASAGDTTQLNTKSFFSNKKGGDDDVTQSQS